MRLFAIRAVRFGPKPTLSSWYPKREFHGTDEMRGSFEGAIRIPLRALSFLFNDLAFLCIPCKSLKFHWFLFSAPTNHVRKALKLKGLQISRSAWGSSLAHRLRVVRPSGSWIERILFGTESNPNAGVSERRFSLQARGEVEIASRGDGVRSIFELPCAGCF